MKNDQWLAASKLPGSGLFAAFLVTVALFTCTTAEAVPAFARQTGQACMSCHFQSFPTLNAYGRVFRASGYTLPGAQPLIEGDSLSLPSNLNMALITKFRYQTLETDKGGRGEVQWPDEAAFLVGGRAADKVGFLAEVNMGANAATGTVDFNDANGNGTIDSGEATVESESHSNLFSAKMHFNLAENLSMVMFGTDSLGVGYGFELLNTGMQRSIRPIENRKGMSAPQILGLDGKATGFAFVYSANDYFINYSHWAPTWGNVNANVAGGLAHYLRAAYTPFIGGWDTGFGGAVWNGTVESGPDDPAIKTHVDAWVVDAQAQGDLSESMSLGLYASYGVTPKGTASEANLYNASVDEDKTAFAATAKLGVGNWRPFVGYASSDTGATTVNDITVGTQYAVAQNINLEVFVVDSDKADGDYTMVSLFSAF